jgi:tRNA(Ile)-lysidine synthase TilS/MesJ
MALRHEFEVLMGKLGLSRGTPVLVAVSGGVDSMALSYLAQQFFGSHVYTATVDHRLREESGEEAQHVHQWMTSMKIDHSILPLDWTEEEKRHPTQIMTEAISEIGTIQSKVQDSTYYDGTSHERPT